MLLYWLLCKLLLVSLQLSLDVSATDAEECMDKGSSVIVVGLRALLPAICRQAASKFLVFVFSINLIRSLKKFLQKTMNKVQSAGMVQPVEFRRSSNANNHKREKIAIKKYMKEKVRVSQERG